MKLKTVKVLHNQCVGPSYYKIGLEAGYGDEEVHPGQFVMIQVPETAGVLLRRPFSIHRIFADDPGNRNIEVLYRVVGQGTEGLTRVRAGDALSLLGPLGKGFSLDPVPDRVCIVAGGIGIAPLHFLIQRMLGTGIEGRRLILLFGGRSRSDAVLLDELSTLVPEIHIATEDGSLGQSGLVTDLLARILEGKHSEAIFACGPQAMLKKVGDMALASGIPCQVSLESAMACGLGACLGCAVENMANQGSYVHVCKDGPVFQLGDFRF